MSALYVVFQLNIGCMRHNEPRNASVISKGAGSYSGQGGRIARKGHPGRRRRIAGCGGKSRAAGANRRQQGQIVQKRHFAMFVIISFLLILEKQ